MTTTIRNKLISRGRIVIILTLLLIIISLIVVGVLLKTSNELRKEFSEMNAIQELKIATYQLLVQANKTSFKKEEENYEFLKILIYETREKLSACEQIISDNHRKKIFDSFSLVLDKTEQTVSQLTRMKQNARSGQPIVQNMMNEINNGLGQIDILLIETKLEVADFAKINKTIFKYSPITIISLGILILIVLWIGGLQFINNLTKPIHRFVDVVNHISQGERNIRINAKTNDEFSLLADAFNNMLTSLEKTTVTKSYLDNILKQMFNALIVVDPSLTIRSANAAACKMLGYTDEHLKKQPIQKLFDNNLSGCFSTENRKDFRSIVKTINKTDHLIHRSGQSIPTLISCTILKNKQGEEEGLIIVGHDLRSKLEAEQKLKKLRAQRQIDINEAQEEERLRIATDLHDGLGQMLTAISYTAQEFNQLQAPNYQLRDQLIQKIDIQIEYAIKESKNLSHNLIPIVLRDFGLVVAIKNMVDRANEMYKVHFTFNAYDLDERINAKLEKALYRICQESMNNIIKHAQATLATYQLFKQENIIVLVIDDDGIGFDISLLEKTGHKGIGLISMKERVLAFGGTFSLYSEHSKGTEIIIEIPCYNT